MLDEDHRRSQKELRARKGRMVFHHGSRRLQSYPATQAHACGMTPSSQSVNDDLTKPNVSDRSIGTLIALQPGGVGSEAGGDATATIASITEAWKPGSQIASVTRDGSPSSRETPSTTQNELADRQGFVLPVAAWGKDCQRWRGCRLLARNCVPSDVFALDYVHSQRCIRRA
jgi:hypothetical protein